MANDSVARALAVAALSSGGEPDAYLKSAAVAGNTLTLTNKDDSTVVFTPDGEPELYLKNASVSGEVLTLTKQDDTTVTFTNTDTTYTAGTGININNDAISIDGTVVASQGDLSTGLATKQDTLTAGSNISINNNTISATDTTYSAGSNVSISNGVISATDTTYTAGSNIQINGSTISATDTTYTAGTGIDITNNVISATGSAPANMVTTDTAQDITGEKTIKYGSDLSIETNFINPTTSKNAVLKLLGSSSRSTAEAKVVVDVGDNVNRPVVTYNYADGTDIYNNGAKYIRINSSSITPRGNNNSVNIGTSSYKFNNGYFSGNIEAANLTDGTTTKSVANVLSTAGTNDGTNWTSLTIDGVTKNIPSGGGSSYTFTNGLTESSGTVSWDLNDIIKNKNGKNLSFNGGMLDTVSADSDNISIGNGQRVGWDQTANNCFAKSNGATSWCSGTNNFVVGQSLKCNTNKMIAFGDGIRCDQPSRANLNRTKLFLGDYPLEQTNITDSYLLTIGNGTPSARSNALTVDWAGNLTCNNIPAPPAADGTYNLQCTISNGVASYSWVSGGSQLPNAEQGSF